MSEVHAGATVHIHAYHIKVLSLRFALYLLGKKN